MKNNNRRGILLASFVETDDESAIQEEVEFIAAELDLTNKYIFLFRNVENPSKKIITYNAITQKGQPFNPRLYTMRVHRKKLTNTLYTINALNLAVAAQHAGATGRDLKLDWDQYANSLLLTRGNNLQVYSIEVVKIFKVEEPPEEN